MSADHDAADALDPDAPAHDIIPDDFVSEWNAQVNQHVATVADALSVAEEAPSTTPRAEMKRCRFCASTKLHFKPGSREYDHKKPEARKCSGCGNHQDQPVPPKAEFGPDEPVCPSCGSWRLVTGFSGEIECLECGDVAAAAVDASAYSPPEQATLGEVTDS